jgi:hypothetical protein
MSRFRFIPLAVALASASTLIACTTAPPVPMGAAPANSMATAERTAGMDAQMKTMRDMHTRMMNAKTAEERQALMADHMKAMQGGMGMMKGLSGMPGMATAGQPGTPPDMAQQRVMGQHMAMMQMMVDMMQQRMPASPARQ